jgi:hypothetical protein
MYTLPTDWGTTTRATTIFTRTDPIGTVVITPPVKC